MFICDVVVKTPPTPEAKKAGGGYPIEGFIDPVDRLLTSEEYDKYITLNPQPIDFGTIISKAVEGDYSSLDEIRSDVNLIVRNCEKYWTTYGGAAEVINLTCSCGSSLITAGCVH